MSIKVYKSLWITLAICLSFGLQAQNAILGQWYNQEKTSKLEVYLENGRYHGKIIWLETTTNSDGSSPRTDEFNPDQELRSVPLQGMVILKDLVWNAEDEEWQDGLIYDPEVGKTYECYCKMQEDGSLYFKGYVYGLTWLGRSTVWSRR